MTGDTVLYNYYWRCGECKNDSEKIGQVPRNSICLFLVCGWFNRSSQGYAIHAMGFSKWSGLEGRKRVQQKEKH